MAEKTTVRSVTYDLLRSLGLTTVFGNPGSTEETFLQEFPGDFRYVLALHEAVAIGAASYYAQASGRTGVVNLHVAPGLGNALGMLYNASKAGSPLLLTAGQQDTRLRLRAPLLGHDLVAMAAPLVKWSAQVERADEMAPLLRRALKIAQDPPSGPVFVALPIDVLAQETAVEALQDVDPEKVFLVQLSDFMWQEVRSREDRIETARHFRVFPGEGVHSDAVAAMVRALDEAGYRGDYSFEVFNDDYRALPLAMVARRARRSVKWLTGLVSRRSLPMRRMQG